MGGRRHGGVRPAASCEVPLAVPAPHLQRASQLVISGPQVAKEAVGARPELGRSLR